MEEENRGKRQRGVGERMEKRNEKEGEEERAKIIKRRKNRRRN